MNAKKQAEQFIQDVDHILHHAPARENEQWPTVKPREQEIIQALATADFSAESQVRQSLKQKLLSAHLGQKEHAMKTQFLQRSFVRLAFASAVMVLLILALSPLGASVAQSVVQIVQNWQLGENTTAVSVDGDFAAVPDENGDIVILPAPEPDADQEEIPVDEGKVEQERNITLDPTISFEQAQARVTFTLRQPSFVPEEYEFQGVVVGNSRQASLDYVNMKEGRLMGLLQTAVGGSHGNVQVTFSSDMTVVDTIVSGREALWMQAGDEGLLVWEADGINYQLAGLSDLELALKVAESLQ